MGCLLADRLDIRLQRVGSGGTKTFTNAGEQLLNVWMAEHAKVVWVAVEDPWVLEGHLIHSLCLPLNLAGNCHGFCKTLSDIRSKAAALAASMPVVDRGGPRRLRTVLSRATRYGFT